MEYLGSLGDDKTVCGGVIRQFQAICAYPHGSWHEEPLVEYLEALCRSRGLFAAGGCGEERDRAIDD